MIASCLVSHPLFLHIYNLETDRMLQGEIVSNWDHLFFSKILLPSVVEFKASCIARFCLLRPVRLPQFLGQHSASTPHKVNWEVIWGKKRSVKYRAHLSACIFLLSGILVSQIMVLWLLSNTFNLLCVCFFFFLHFIQFLSCSQ